MPKNHLAVLISSLILAAATAAPALSQQALTIAVPPLKEEVSKRPQEGKIEAHDFVFNSSAWEKYYRNGVSALDDRRFDQAEQMLLKSIKEAKGVGTTAKDLMLSRLALADLYLKQHRFTEAHSLYESTLPKAESNFGSNSEEMAKSLYGLAYTELKFDKEKLAKEHAEAAIRILKDTDKTDTQLFGLCLHTMGLIMAKHGWADDAKPLCAMSRKILERHPGTRKLDLAETLREQSLFFHSLGDRHTAHDLYETSYQIREKAVSTTQPPSIVGEVRFEWEPGSTRAQEIIDNDFPFRYMSAHGIRVACTIVDLWELLTILVTVTNVGDHQEEFELGRIVLERASHGTIQTQNKEIPTVDPNRIDRIQKERNMWDLTHTRPWLANIQKTRTVRGLVPPNGHDLFMGPNVFGVYGDWKAISHIVPERVGVLPSREGLVAAESTAVDLPGLVRPSKAKLVGLTPVWLEPFESRTGEQFYLYPRDADIIIKIPVGNAIFEFPFRTRKFKLPRSI
ncbi:MAG: tetratricopeptide repeat protein [Candidatus Obscuribacterales bacterium]|nr:tetratricopeptide repeat protein [Candidatus Obscuribacterales bacterium]